MLTFNPFTNQATPGITGEGIVYSSIDTLPCEVPRVSSRFFERCLMQYMHGLLEADFHADYETGILTLPEEMRPAMLVWLGEPHYPKEFMPAVEMGLRLYGRQETYHYR